MASTNTKTSPFIPDLEAATERATQANERLLEAGRKVTSAYLDGVEKYASGVAQFEHKLGEQSGLEPFAGFLHAHAQLTEDVTKASVRAARELIA